MNKKVREVTVLYADGSADFVRVEIENKRDDKGQITLVCQDQYVWPGTIDAVAKALETEGIRLKGEYKDLDGYFRQVR